MLTQNVFFQAPTETSAKTIASYRMIENNSNKEIAKIKKTTTAETALAQLITAR